jgi:hypothetical protein
MKYPVSWNRIGVIAENPKVYILLFKEPFPEPIYFNSLFYFFSCPSGLFPDGDNEVIN